ncbi:MAG: phosphodiesterase [Mycobacteriaceae bacterium]|nr:phosphodiesterase [Mycobacteriaceae bacterium]
MQWAAALRHRRVFHPDGVLANGTIERVAPPHEGLPVPASAEVVARVSKGVGAPGRLPDVIGLAVRIPPEPFAATPWDILLASAGSGLVTRVVGVRPATSWSGQTMTTLMPLRYEGSNWWLRARITTQMPGRGVALADIGEEIGHGGIEIDIDQACGTGDFAPLAQLCLTNVIIPAPGEDVSFDPALHTAPDVRLYPGWLADLRVRAYGRSREGRDAD